MLSDEANPLPFLQRYLSRGKIYYYFRRYKHQIRIRGTFGSDEFLSEYGAALKLPPPVIAIDPPRGKPTKVILWNAIGRARKKGLPISLTHDDVRRMLIEQNNKCAVSGIAFDFRKASPTEQYAPWRPSLDRIDNTKGYELGNVRLVCVIANFAMGKWGQECLGRLAQAVVVLNKSKTGLPSATDQKSYSIAKQNEIPTTL